MKDQVHDDVLLHLHQGKVLPIFHTLCRPPKERLFPPNTRVGKDDETSMEEIQISTAPVSRGECVKDTVESEISMFNEMSYIPAFFNEHNTGHFYVKDTTFRWTFDH